MRYPLHKILPAALMLFAVTGCVKEDRSECNPGALLMYDYSLNTENTNLFEKEVDKVTVHVFDENGLYFDTFSDEGDHLTNSWRMLLPIPPGKYTTVTWGGDMGTYRTTETVKGVTHIDDFILTAEKDGQPLARLDDLYHGKADVVSAYSPDADDAVIVQLMKDTKKLTVTVEDQLVEQGRNGIPPYDVYCTATNAKYTATNDIPSDAAEVRNIPYNYYINPGEAVAELDLLRLFLGRPLKLTVKNADGKAVFDKDLVETIKLTGKYRTQEDLDREDEYHVKIRIDKDIAVSVTINGWESIDIKPEL